jgi:type I restriction enzyme R subunit
LDPEKRQDYYTYFRQLESLYEIISPDPFLRDFMDDYQKLADVYSILRSKYDSSSLAMRELARKTAKLVQDRVIPGQIYQPDKTVAITPETLRQLAKGQKSEIEKVIDLGNGITIKANREGAYAPYLFSIGERAQIIIEKFKERQLTTQEALKQLEELIDELSQAENEQQKSGLDGSAFAVLWLVEKEGILRDKAELAAKEMTAAFSKYPFWQKSEDQARHIRTSLYQALEPTGAADIPGIVDKIMTVLMREQS